MSDTFGELLTHIRMRKPGLSQNRLAELAGYDRAVLARMAQGKKDLTGPSGRDRVLRIVRALQDEGVRLNLNEVNALLAAGDMPPLYEGLPAELALIRAFSISTNAFADERHTLPNPLSSFVGRERELADIAALIQSTRLLTLAGVGGCGKTRLALEASRSCADAFAHGIRYVELAPVPQADAVAITIARSIGARVLPDETALSAIIRTLAGKLLLLVLDNFEHVLEAGALVVSILTQAPGVKVLSTSREPLRLSGEHVYRVKPLPVPAATQHLDTDMLIAEYPAIRLFALRAKAVQFDFNLSERNVAAVVEICRRLEGLPLGIELAAAHMRHTTPQQMLDKLSELAVERSRGGTLSLTSEVWDVPPRHRTLRSALAWSYDLLTPDEQQWFRCLGAFAGGAPLTLVERVHHLLAGKPDWADASGSDDAELALYALMDKSLIHVLQDGAGEARYGMLELIRDYALDEMSARGEQLTVFGAHARTMLALASEARPFLFGPDALHWCDRLEHDYNNFRVALARSFDHGGDPEIGVRLVAELSIYWAARGYHREGEHWSRVAQAHPASMNQPTARGWILLFDFSRGSYALDQVLARADEALNLFRRAHDDEGRAMCLCMAGMLALRHGDEVHGRPMLDEGIALGRAANCPHVVEQGVFALADHAVTTGEYATARVLVKELFEISRQVGDPNHIAGNHYLAARLALCELDFVNAIVLGERGVELSRTAGDPIHELIAGFVCAEATRCRGDAEQAVIMLEGRLALARELGDARFIAQALLLLGKAACDAGDAQHAGMCLAEGLGVSRAMAAGTLDEIYAVQVLDACACVAASQSNASHAAAEWGCCDGWRVDHNHLRFPHDQHVCANYIAKARAALGDEAYDAACTEGRAMTLEQAIHYALSQSDEGDT